MEKVNHILQLTGQPDLWTFFYYFFFAMIGVIVISGIDLKTRDKQGERLPEKFNLVVFISDNFRKWGISFLLIYLALRFTTEITGLKITDWIAVMIGLGSDGLTTAIKKYSTIFNMKQGKEDS